MMLAGLVEPEKEVANLDGDIRCADASQDEGISVHF
jgi:hypothetical protein